MSIETNKQGRKADNTILIHLTHFSISSGPKSVIWNEEPSHARNQYRKRV
jgi:hypothetical protein